VKDFRVVDLISFESSYSVDLGLQFGWISFSWMICVFINNNRG